MPLASPKSIPILKFGSSYPSSSYPSTSGEVSVERCSKKPFPQPTKPGKAHCTLILIPMLNRSIWRVAQFELEPNSRLSRVIQPESGHSCICTWVLPSHCSTMPIAACGQVPALSFMAFRPHAATNRSAQTPGINVHIPRLRSRPQQRHTRFDGPQSTRPLAWYTGSKHGTRIVGAGVPPRPIYLRP